MLKFLNIEVIFITIIGLFLFNGCGYMSDKISPTEHTGSIQKKNLDSSYLNIKNKSDTVPVFEDKDNHVFGHILQVKYYLLDIPIVGLFANHTYPIAFYGNDKNISWEALGGKEGGKILDGTTTECKKGEKCIDLSTVNYIMDENLSKSCMWPKKEYYALVGVCWNATNRGLYFTKKTVHNIKFYPLIEDWFGTYGLDDKSSWCITKKCKEAREKFSWTKCLNEVKKNYPWKADKKIDTNKGIQYEVSDIDADPRIELYKQYAEKNITKSSNEKEVDYLSKLFELNIEQRLGKSTGDKGYVGIGSDRIKYLKIELLKIHQKYQRIRIIPNPELKAIDENNQEEYLDNLNKMMNAELEEYKKVLSDEEYQKLFGATKDEKFDIKRY